MTEKKNINTFQEAYEVLKQNGKVDLLTAGGDLWNRNIARRLSNGIGAKVLYAGMASGYNDSKHHTFVMEVKTNKEAKILLSQEYD